MSTAQFYDGLTDTYHALYPDWQDETRTQADALHRLLCRWHQGPADIVDVACGIGTQLIGLARLGHRLTGSDISVRAVRRARRECAAADVRARLLVADMRSLPRVISFQLRTWRENSGIYDLEHFQVHESADGTRTTERRTAAYRAYRRAALAELAVAAGLQDVSWQDPRESGFFQPLMTAHHSR
jgi:SAM-dependent methyltransferase